MKQLTEQSVENDSSPADTQTGHLSRRQAIKKSSIALGACYLAPATLNLLLADRATAQSDIPPPEPEPEYNRRLCVCNFMPLETDVLTVEYIDILGWDTVLLPGGTGVTEQSTFDKIMDNSEAIITVSTPAYFHHLATPDATSLANLMRAGNTKGAMALLSSAAQGSSEPATELVLPMTQNYRIVVTSDPV